eukprot:1195339-Prorocentrum_minimum.AAC.3
MSLQLRRTAACSLLAAMALTESGPMSKGSLNRLWAVVPPCRRSDANPDVAQAMAMSPCIRTLSSIRERRNVLPQPPTASTKKKPPPGVAPRTAPNTAS